MEAKTHIHHHRGKSFVRGVVLMNFVWERMDVKNGHHMVKLSTVNQGESIPLVWLASLRSLVIKIWTDVRIAWLLVWIHALRTGDNHFITEILSSPSELKHSNKSDTIFDMFLNSMDEPDSFDSLARKARRRELHSSFKTCWQEAVSKVVKSLWVSMLIRNLVIHLRAYSTFSK